ncbi:uncharacterized protein LOC142343175 isoform X2 [Convolutriloba macropyga]|uniref:uncharacterized protein LOC142343175 isoform X2 n=1 Tax=Convolutriloba macropyga TaxID=536237 RepID=UPI003F526642
MTSPQRKSSQAEELHKVGEQLVELVAKIQLIEEDRKGFVESSNFTYKSNDAKISALRSENKELAKKFVKSSTTYEETLDIVFEEKYKTRNTEAEEIQKAFFKATETLREENKLYIFNLEDLDQQIVENEDELMALQELRRDAQISKHYAQLDLDMQEKNAETRKRNTEKKKMAERKIADKRESEYENLNNLIEGEEASNKPRNLDDHDPNDAEWRKFMQSKAEETEKRVSDMEKLNQKVKEKTGLYSNDDAIKYFKQQYDQRSSLEGKIDEKTEEINDLMTKKQSLQETFEDLKYVDSNSLAESTSAIESHEPDEYEDETKYDFNQARLTDAERRLSKSRETAKDIQSTVDHLQEKLSTVKNPTRRKKRQPDQFVDQKPTEAESIVDSLDKVSEKLDHLYQDIGRDTDTKKVLQEIDQSDFGKTVQEKMPPDNSRYQNEVKSQYFDQSQIEDEEGLYDDKAPSRKDVKRASRVLIDQKMNKRPNKKNVKRFR